MPSARRTTPGFDQARKGAPQLRVFQFGQLDRTAGFPRDRLQFRPFPAAQPAADEAQIAHRVIAHRGPQPLQDLRLHEVELLNPHRPRHLHHRRMELQAVDLRAPSDRLAHHLGPQPHQPHDLEMPFRVEPRKDLLQRAADLLRGFPSSAPCHARYDSAYSLASNKRGSYLSNGIDIPEVTPALFYGVAIALNDQHTDGLFYY